MLEHGKRFRDQASKSVKEKHEKDIENLKKSNRKGIEKVFLSIILL